MIYLLTGTPGHGKTQRALWMLLHDKRFKGRPVLYANVRGLKADDERIKNWIELTDVKQWETAPQGAVIFIDECHQVGYFPLRGVGKPPPWIEAIATHRHLGLDFVLVTQNAKNMDVFVRRMVELHIHCKRPAQMGYTNVYEFQSFTDCDDRIPVDSALRHSRWNLDKHIWTLYESAAEHTGKAKVPRIFFIIPLLFFAFVVAGVFAWNWAQNKQAVKPPLPLSSLAVAVPPLFIPPGKTGAQSVVSLSRMSPQARVEATMHDSRDFAFDRVPLNPDYPESAPLYRDLRAVKAFPRVAGCAVSKGDCRCIDQQGTPSRVTPASCFDFVFNGRFDPYRDDKRDLGERSATNAAPVVGASLGAGNCSTFVVFGIGGSSSLETRCTGPTAAPFAAGAAVPQTSSATSGAGSVGEPGGMPVPSIARGGYVGTSGVTGNAAVPR